MTGCPMGSQFESYDVVAPVKPMYLTGCEGGFGCDCVYLRAGYLTRLENLKGHGTRAKYQGGCRCLPCRRANAGYTKAYREKVRRGWKSEPLS